MKQNAKVLAACTAALIASTTLGVGCGGRIAPETGGTGGSSGIGGSAPTGGTGGSTGGADGTGGSSGADGTGGATGGAGGAAGSTGGTDGTGGTTGGSGGTGGAAGGTGGAAGSSGGTGGSAGGPIPPGAIMCGMSICRPLAGSPLGTLPPCCPMDLPDACGAVVAVANGACLTATPGVPDARCPAVAVPGGGITLAGCCRPNGMCGVNLDLIQLGCNDPIPVGGAPPGRCGADP